jgi:hypothetical protein
MFCTRAAIATAAEGLLRDGTEGASQGYCAPQGLEGALRREATAQGPPGQHYGALWRYGHGILGPQLAHNAPAAPSEREPAIQSCLNITQQPSTSLNNPQHHSTTLNITQTFSKHSQGLDRV